MRIILILLQLHDFRSSLLSEQEFKFLYRLSVALSIDSADVNCIAPLKSVDQQCLSCKFNTDFQRYPTPEPQLASENSRCCNEEPDLLMMWPSYFVQQQLILEKSVTWNFSKRIFSSFTIFLFLLPRAGRTILPRMSLLLRRPFLYVKGLITLQHRKEWNTFITLLQENL